MKERPILFSGEMVRAILEGHKTQTRRIINPQPAKDGWITEGWISKKGQCFYVTDLLYIKSYRRLVCPYGSIGDRLWVRETWLKNEHGVLYKAGNFCMESFVTWKPSTFMPRWASRITLEIVNIRVERVKDISEKDCDREGCPWDKNSDLKHRIWFEHLWNSINAKKGYGWDVNPWVWVIEFKRLLKP